MKAFEVKERNIQPQDLPGVLLNMALLNLCSDDITLRLSSYQFLETLSLVFNFDVQNTVLFSKGLYITSNNLDFVANLSRMFSESEQHLTFDFISEFLIGFSKSSLALKKKSLSYLSPWLTNLQNFLMASEHKNYETSRCEILINGLINMTLGEAEVNRLN